MDTTTEPILSGPRLGRLINHGDKPKDRNSKLRVLSISNRPHLCFFATRDIAFGEQILYDYGIPVPWVRVFSVLIYSRANFSNDHNSE